MPDTRGLPRTNPMAHNGRCFSTMASSRRLFTTLLLVAFAVLMIGALGVVWHWQPLVTEDGRDSGAILLAPMMNLTDTCIVSGGDAGARTLQQQCTGPSGSAATLVESTLEQLQPLAPPEGAGFVLGYTLAVPLLQFFQVQGDDWVIDEERIRRVARTIRDNQRPLILYLSSNPVSAHAPIEPALARNPDNLAQTRDGPLPIDSYHGEPLYPWTVARTDTPITERRVQAAQALLGELCKLPPHDLAKIRGVSLLGELQQMSPHFETGMGFNGTYRVSDYSPASVAGFRHYLQAQFGTVERLNEAMGSDYRSLDEVAPPSRDIRSEPLAHYTEHIDPFAHGSLPIMGWAWLPGDGELWVQVYRDGAFIGRVPVNRERQDVLVANPKFGRADTGWRLDMDFRQLPVGLHRIDALLELAPGKLVPIGSRDIAIMDRRQQAPDHLPPQAPLPATITPPEGVQLQLDLPRQRQSFYYNPLVPPWHAWRREQVARYLHFFGDVVARSCLKDTPRYTHQVLPEANPRWDANKFAVGDTLRTTDDIRLGVNLYGDASHGKEYAKWLGTMGRHNYGITGFHPLRAMDATELKAVLRRHGMRGARFLTFSIDPYWEGRRLASARNVLSLDPENPQFGSALLYRAMQETLRAGVTQPR